MDQFDTKGTQVLPNDFELDETARLRLLGLRDRSRGQLDALARDFVRDLTSDERTFAVRLVASSDGSQMTSTARRWLDEVLCASVEVPQTPRTHFGLFDSADLSEIPQERLVRALGLVRRRLVELTLASDDSMASIAETILAIQRALDRQLVGVLQAHRQVLLDRLMANERLAAIGQLVASIGHELRNPLSTIETSAYLVIQRLANLDSVDANVHRHLDKIRHQVRVATKTVADLLELAKNRPPRLTSVELRPLVDVALSYLRCPVGVRIELDVPAGLSVSADADQLRIILVNLLTNALDAVGGSGSIAVTATADEAGTSLVVRDDGPGIPTANQQRIFEALYTTKPNGNGLGLPLCRRIAVAHGGELALLPCEQGATFRLWLPRPVNLLRENS